MDSNKNQQSTPFKRFQLRKDQLLLPAVSVKHEDPQSISRLCRLALTLKSRVTQTFKNHYTQMNLN